MASTSQKSFSKRRSLPPAHNTFDIAFSKLYPHGKDGKLVSAEYLIQLRLCRDALAGKRKAIAQILRIAENQEKARDLCRKQHGHYEDYDLAAPISKQDRERRATTAMLLLSVAAQAKADGPVLIEPWVSELAQDRDGAPVVSDHNRERIERFTRDGDAPVPAVFRLPPLAVPERRSAKDTRFKKGQSGNPKGRPKKVTYDLPYTDYFDEVGLVTVNGKDVRMTRLQFVLHMLDMKAIKGDSCMTAVLAGKYMQERLRRYARGELRRDEAPLHNRHNLPPRIATDPFEQMLRTFCITNPRTKTRVLLEPWVVEAALKRFGERRLTLEEQAEVLISTSKPGTVAWPDWWEIRSHAQAKPYRLVKPRFQGTRDPDYDARIL